MKQQMISMSFSKLWLTMTCRKYFKNGIKKLKINSGIPLKIQKKNLKIPSPEFHTKFGMSMDTVHVLMLPSQVSCRLLFLNYR